MRVYCDGFFGTAYKLFLSVVVLAFLSGCATSPVSSGARSTFDAGNLLTMAAAGAAGGFIGNQIAPGGLGAAAGTGIGIFGAAILSDLATRYSEQQKAEAYERGKREARLEVMEQYWYDQTTSYDPNADRALGAGERPTRDIRYEAMIDQGVRMNQRLQTLPVGPYEATRAPIAETPISAN